MVKSFLIGAGATRAQYSNAPLNSDFFKQLNIQDHHRYKAIESTIKPHINDSLENLDIEQVMTLSYEFPISVKTAFFESIYQAIYELLVNSTNSDESYIQSAHRGQIRTHPTLFKVLLNDPRLNKEDFFMTLNYDLYLDREVLAVNGFVDYGITKEMMHTATNMPLNFVYHDFSVYHLHGSLNWELVNENTLIIRMGAVGPTYKRTGSNLYLVPPGKKELYPILKSIWTIAKTRLLDADELIIIGCSLNPNDVDLIDLIKEFIKAKGIDKVKIIGSVAHDPTCDLKFTQVIGHGFKLHPHGFNISGAHGYKGSIEFIFS